MYRFLNNNLISVFFSISVLILLSAYFIEIVLGYEACNLCLIGRIPYFFVIAFSLIFFFFEKFKKIIEAKATIVRPIIVAHIAPFFSKKTENVEPNLNDK